MAEKNEYDDYFSGNAPAAPVRKTRKPEVASEGSPETAADVVSAEASNSGENPYHDEFGIPAAEDEALAETQRLENHEDTAKQQERQAKEHELQRNMNFGVAAAGVPLGMAARAKYGSPMDLTKGPAGNAYTKWIERKYNLPEGSFEAYQKQRAIQAGSDPAMDAWARDMEQQAAAKTPAQNVVIEHATAPPLPVEEKTSGMYRSMRPNVGHEALMPSDARLAEVTSTLGSDPTGLPKLVVENAHGINVARNLGYDPLQAQRHGEAGIMLPPKSSQQIAQEAQAAAREAEDVAHAKRVADFEQALRTPVRPEDAPITPKGALPTARTAAAPVASPIPQTAAEYRAAMAPAQTAAQTHGKMAGHAMGALGGALTLEQAYQMAKDYYNKKIMPDWTQWASLAGGPLATFGGARLGPAGLAMQIPYAVKHREDIARGMTMGDIAPYGTLTEAEANAPVPIFHTNRQ